MNILAIETSCDETSVAIIENRDNNPYVLSNITATSLQLHGITGGIIPETAAREQVKYIIPTLQKAVEQASPQKASPEFTFTKDYIKKHIDAIAVTVGPGLIGSLLIGVETAKTLALALHKPIIPINHLLGHIFANFLSDNTTPQQPISYPAVALIISGAHTDLLYFSSHTTYIWLGGTRDDAAGEAFDKIGRMLNFPYPAGAEIERRSKLVNASQFSFKSPLLHSDDFEFSFSGLKTEVQREIKKREAIDNQLKNEICYATQKAIITVLIAKTLKAVKKYNVKTVLLGGGVASNQTLRVELQQTVHKENLDTHIYAPPHRYCTDNAAMIASAAFFNPQMKPWNEINANPELYFA